MFVLRAAGAEEGFDVFFDEVRKGDDAVGFVLEHAVAGYAGGAGFVDGVDGGGVFRPHISEHGFERGNLQIGFVRVVCAARDKQVYKLLEVGDAAVEAHLRSRDALRRFVNIGRRRVVRDCFRGAFALQFTRNRAQIVGKKLVGRADRRRVDDARDKRREPFENVLTLVEHDGFRRGFRRDGVFRRFKTAQAGFESGDSFAEPADYKPLQRSLRLKCNLQN